MKSLKETLNQICYAYYPKDMHESDTLYTEAIETKKLFSRIASVSLNEFDALTEDINSIYTNASNFKMGENFPCYIIQVDLASTKKHKSVITIYLSYLIPYYSLVVLKGNYNDGSIQIDLEREEKERKVIDSLKAYITKQIKYHEFERDLLDKQIPQIMLYENFTYFNAFFNDAHRINYK